MLKCVLSKKQMELCINIDEISDMVNRTEFLRGSFFFLVNLVYSCMFNIVWMQNAANEKVESVSL